MKCAELLAAVNQYVDGELEPGICNPFQEHIKGCNPCQIVVDNIQQTIKLFRAEEQYGMPSALHLRLSEALLHPAAGRFPFDGRETQCNATR
jgi:hypothetical protein